MLKNITLSAEDVLIHKARERAAANQTTLNTLFRKWLEQYAGHGASTSDFEQLMGSLSYAKPGKKLSREEMNGR